MHLSGGSAQVIYLPPSLRENTTSQATALSCLPFWWAMLQTLDLTSPCFPACLLYSSFFYLFPGLDPWRGLPTLRWRSLASGKKDSLLLKSVLEFAYLWTVADFQFAICWLAASSAGTEKSWPIKSLLWVQLLAYIIYWLAFSIKTVGLQCLCAYVCDPCLITTFSAIVWMVMALKKLYLKLVLEVPAVAVPPPNHIWTLNS